MDTATFSSRGGAGAEVQYVEEVARTDPPQHERLHVVVRQAVSPAILKRLRVEVPQITDALIDAFADRGEADLYAELAMRLPLTVVARILGVPDEDAPRLKEWADLKLLGMRGRLDTETERACAEADGAWRDYFREALDDRARLPRGDF